MTELTGLIGLKGRLNFSILADPATFPASNSVLDFIFD